MMKRIRLKHGLGLAMLLLCGPASAADRLNVFACEPEWAVLARALGGDRVEVSSATTAQQDPHHIQARPSLIAKARRADMLVCTGAELEVGWLPLLLRKSGNGRIQPGQPGYFMAAEQVSLIGKPVLLDRSQGDVHAAGNPHVHLDPYRMAHIAPGLTVVMKQLDPENGEAYQANLDRFLLDWNQAIARWEQAAQPLQGQRVVVHHNSWVYLERWLKLEQLATLEPKSGIPPTSRHLSQLLTLLKTKPAGMILYAGYQNDQAARWVSERTGIPAVALPFSPSEDESLFEWFDRLIKQLLEVQA